MFTSLALVILLGLALSGVCKRLHLPGIIGMLATGILLGPYCLDLLDPVILSISPDLRQMALIIILLKAGLSFKFSDLKQVGRPAVMMSCVPASCEVLAFFLFAPPLLGVSHLEAALMGAVLGAVSPAVVVPRMVNLIERRYGTDKHIPQMMIAGASCDDIFVIVLFTTFLGMVQKGTTDLTGFLNIPISVATGVLLGCSTGWLLNTFFESAYQKQHYVRNSLKVIVMLGASFLLVAIETHLEGILPVSGLLAVVSMATTINQRSSAFVSARLSEKLGKLWLAAEVILFVLVGAAVDIRFTLEAGFPVVHDFHFPCVPQHGCFPLHAGYPSG